MIATIKHNGMDVVISDNDVVNVGNHIPYGEYNPHSIHPWVLLDHGFVVCIVFASCLQDALDDAADANKLDRYLIDSKDLDDYKFNTDDEFCTCLGNACEPFDIDSLEYIELENPRRSFVAEYVAVH